MLAIRNLGLAGLFGLLVTAFPMLVGLAYAVRPKERLLALMRPLTLAGIFAATANVFLGVTNEFVWVSRNTVPSPFDPRLMAGWAEVMVVGFASFVFLSVGWLGVAVGMRKVP
jgi:hypothetical protein